MKYTCAEAKAYNYEDMWTEILLYLINNKQGKK